jgi:hypothetical protein
MNQPTLDAIWEILQEVAAAGARCPTADGIAFRLEQRGIRARPGNAVAILARQGKCRIEVGVHNGAPSRSSKGRRAARPRCATRVGARRTGPSTRTATIGGRGG